MTKSDTLSAFLTESGAGTARKPSLIGDRSTLQHYATCPRQGYLCQHGDALTTTSAMDSGSEGHEAISRVIGWLVELTPGEWFQLGAECIKAELVTQVQQARPDVQPDVIRALNPSLWRIAKLLARTRPEDILRFDGGEGDRSGQLAWDVDTEHGAVTVTSELDLLISELTRDEKQPEQMRGGLRVIDWKTGQQAWTADRVADSFQFAVQTWLVFRNYEDVNLVSCEVWETRHNRTTFPARFYRDRLAELEARITSAATIYAHWHNAHEQWVGDQKTEVPVWPTVEKCEACPVAALCGDVGRPAASLAEDAGKYLDAYVALDAELAARRKALTAWSDKHGTIRSGCGNCWGRDKPPSRKPNAGSWQEQPASPPQPAAAASVPPTEDDSPFQLSADSGDVQASKTPFPDEEPLP